MKATEIKADGTVYWFERGNDWGKFLTPMYDRGQVKRLDDKRYQRVGTYRPTYVEDPKGKYILVERTDDNRDNTYVLPVQVRDTYEAVKARYEKAKKAEKAADAEHAVQLAAADERADALRERLANLGLDKIIHVRVTGQNAWRNEMPAIKAELLTGSESELERMLKLIDDQL